MMANFDLNTDFATLIPELSRWNNGKGISVDAWISGEGDYEHLVGYSRILWPNFVEYDQCILRAGFSKKSYKGFLQQTKGNRTAVEAVMNHEHVLDLFVNAEPKPTREMVLYIGRLLKEIWQAKLSRDFPGKAITVSFPEDYSEDLVEYEITFFQVR
jgi:hypothetical protein